MPTSPFTITTGSNTVLLNAERKGEAAFTVSNISGRPLRGRGMLSMLNPLGQTVPAWLSITGEAERDFGIAATQQYAVQVAVPLDAAQGDYTFRLDMVGVDNPDENFTQGPVVQFQVAPLPVPPPPPPFPWWIVAVVAGIIVIGVIVFLLTRPQPVSFSGRWTLAGDRFFAGAFADLVQNGSSLSGTYNTGTIDGRITGTVSGQTASGRWTQSNGTGTFQWVLVNNRDDQFVGNWNASFAWCGFRNGSSQPSPCLGP